jgi:hypothetical protein
MMVAGNLRSDRPHSALQSRLRRGVMVAGTIAALIAPS